MSRDEGPTYENIKDFLKPLMFAGSSLTESGVYYIPGEELIYMLDIFDSLDKTIYVARLNDPAPCNKCNEEHACPEPLYGLEIQYREYI